MPSTRYTVPVNRPIHLEWQIYPLLSCLNGESLLKSKAKIIWSKSPTQSANNHGKFTSHSWHSPYVASEDFLSASQKAVNLIPFHQSIHVPTFQIQGWFFDKYWSFVLLWYLVILWVSRLRRIHFTGLESHYLNCEQRRVSNSVMFRTSILHGNMETVKGSLKGPWWV